MGLSPKQMHDKIIHNLPEKTGKSLTEWRTIYQQLPPGLSHQEQTQLLKTEHQLGHFTAIALVNEFNGGNPH